MTIFLVRHGETEWNRARRYQGWSDSPLTPLGIAQAEAIGRRLAGCPMPPRPPSSPARSAAPAAPPRSSPSASAAPSRRCSTTGCARSRSARGTGSTAARSTARAPALFEGDGYWEWYFQTPDGETYDGFAGRIAGWLAEAARRPADRRRARHRDPRLARPLCRPAARRGAAPGGAAGPDLPLAGTPREIALDRLDSLASPPPRWGGLGRERSVRMPEVTASQVYKPLHDAGITGITALFGG